LLVIYYDGRQAEKDLAEAKPMPQAVSGSLPQPGGEPARARRRSVRPSNVLVAALTLFGAIWGGWWLYDRLNNVYVLDASIASDMLLLSSRVPGWVVKIPVTEALQVNQGDSLILIDDRTAVAHLDELQAGVRVFNAAIDSIDARIELISGRTRSRIEAADARLDAALSEQTAAKGDLEIAQAEWHRAGPLRERNLLSQQEFEADRNTFRNAEQIANRRQAEVASARADLAEARSEIAEIKVLEADRARVNNERSQATLQFDQARTELSYHTIQATTDGVIDELFIDPGEYVAAGQRVLMMHDQKDIWVKANIKETDVQHVATGDQVEIVVDAYSDETRTGTVVRIGGAVRSQFALLPNPNPSGNFTKTTQRIELKIELHDYDDRLKPGMMVEVKIPRARETPVSGPQ
jgi:membrane fusion protein (multidrug efflux system)